MPQMSPMFWIVFPFFMTGLVVVGAVVVGYEYVIDSGGEDCLFKEGEEKMKW